jgi:hypothetical protein
MEASTIRSTPETEFSYRLIKGYCYTMPKENKYAQKTAKEYLPLSKAVREATGTSPHLSTILRWCTKGARGRTLAYVLIGGRKMTTVEDVNDFVQVFEAKTMTKCLDHKMPASRTNAIDKAVLDLNKILGN